MSEGVGASVKCKEAKPISAHLLEVSEAVDKNDLIMPATPPKDWALINSAKMAAE